MKEVTKNGMEDVAEQLRNALRRKEPPAGFAERVLGQVAYVERRSTRSTLRVGYWAAAAALVAAMAGGIQYRAIQKERAEGEAAKARVVLALHIAGSKLQLVQTKINRTREQPEKNSNQ